MRKDPIFILGTLLIYSTLAVVVGSVAWFASFKPL